MRLVHRPLPGPAAIDGGAGQLGELFQLGGRIRPEDAVAPGDERLLRLVEEFHRPLDLARVTLRAQLVRIVDLGAPALLFLVVSVVEDVGGDFQQGDPLRRGRSLAERLAQVDLDRRPVQDALGKLGEAADDL